VYRLRGSLLPLVNLNQLLKIGERGPGRAEKAADPAAERNTTAVAALDTGSAVSVASGA